MVKQLKMEKINGLITPEEAKKMAEKGEFVLDITSPNSIIITATTKKTFRESKGFINVINDIGKKFESIDLMDHNSNKDINNMFIRICMLDNDTEIKNTYKKHKNVVGITVGIRNINYMLAEQMDHSTEFVLSNIINALPILKSIKGINVKTLQDAIRSFIMLC
jgi:hypothetical protein